ncbi:MAG: 50S ribosomal protein L1 [Candidatus Marinimicrobia bacterium]|nr:50S ribosomal protein L1 [Candidatus Neomarinimicrobiota bacterium]
MGHGKFYRAAAEKIDRNRSYSATDAVALLKETARPNFDESVELAMNLGVDPRHADQMVRGTVNLPHGTGRSTRVLVFAAGEKAMEATQAGADYVGAGDMIEKVRGGWLEFEAVVATPDMMKEVGKLGGILGPRKLMPSPKGGTVTNDVAKTIQELKAGKIEFRVDKQGIINVAIGKASFSAEEIEENLRTVIEAVMRARPSAAKGAYLQKLTVCTSMGPGIKIDKAIYA